MRPLVYSLMLFLLGVSVVEAKPLVEKDKVIEKEFSISDNGTLDIYNKFGSVTVKEGPSGKVNIKVTIEVKTSSQSKAEDIFDKIEIDFSDSRDYVSAKTIIEEESSWFNWFSWGSRTDYKINYEIAMPPSLHLKMENKFGDIYLPDLNNGLDIIMKYGNVVMRSVEGITNLELGYGKVDFGDLGALNAEIKYSKLYGSSTQKCKIDSKYSRIEIGDIASMKSYSKHDHYILGRVSEIKNEGKYDDWKIDEINHFTSYTKYTTIEIDLLHGDLSIDQKYGSVKVEEMTCEAAEIDLDVEYTNVSLAPGSCGMELDYEGKYTDINLPSDIKGMVERDGNESWFKTTSGNSAKRMNIDMEYGSLKIW